MRKLLFVELDYVIIVLAFSTFIGTLEIYYNEMYKDVGITGEHLQQAKIVGQIRDAITEILDCFFCIGITFVTLLLIAKIMNSYTSGKPIFSSTLSHILITRIISLIIIIGSMYRRFITNRLFYSLQTIFLNLYLFGHLHIF